MSTFPVTATDDPVPSDPKAEPTREYYNAHPEEPGRMIARTRRYFRLVHKSAKLHYAKGLESAPGEFA